MSKNKIGADDTLCHTLDTKRICFFSKKTAYKSVNAVIIYPCPLFYKQGNQFP